MSLTEASDRLSINSTADTLASANALTAEQVVRISGKNTIDEARYLCSITVL